MLSKRTDRVLSEYKDLPDQEDTTAFRVIIVVLIVIVTVSIITHLAFLKG